MRVIRNLLLYTAAAVVALAALPSAVLGWYAISPHSFGDALHAVVDVLDPIGESQATAEADEPAPRIVAVQ